MNTSRRASGIAVVGASTALIAALTVIVAVGASAGISPWLLGIGTALGVMLLIVAGIGIGLVMSHNRGRRAQ